MPDQQLEIRIGMDLACRTYLYDLLHYVFGGNCSSEFVAKLFGSQTREMFAREAAALSDEGLSLDAGRALSKIGRSLGDCAKEALMCLDEHQNMSADALALFAAQMESDFTKLFQVPGDSYVHMWESPYVGTEQTLFQGSTLDVRAVYHAAGLKLQAERQFPDDHIAAMLAYMGCMGTRAYDAYADGLDAECRKALQDAKAFLEAHLLTWIDALAADVIEKDEHGLYAAFMQAVVVLAHVDAVQLDWLMKRIGE